MIASNFSPTPSTPSTSPWEHWSTETWGYRLLEHFFVRKPGGDQNPVSCLSATAEELARVAGEPPDRAEAVRDSFVRTVVDDASAEAGVLDRGFDGWSPIDPETEPPVMAPLFLTCLAASEILNSQCGEDEFIAPLQDLCGGRAGNLENLPLLWQRFQEWLCASPNPSRFRDLVLPDPGSWRRVGYSVKLAFPSRHDRQELVRLLREEELDGDEPPVARVISCVAGERGRFRRGFQLAFEEFRTAINAAVAAEQSRLLTHRFWSAVRDAASSQSETSVMNALREFGLIACPAEDSLIPMIVTNADDTPAPDGFVVVPFEFAVGAWTHGLAVDGGDSDRFDTAAEKFLSGVARVPSLSRVLRDGFIPFKEGQDGVLEIAECFELDLVSCALVRTAATDVVCRLFGTKRMRKRDSRVSGWSEVYGISPHVVDGTTLKDTPLARCWFLHASPRRPRLRFVEGIACDDGWLGFAHHLPDVRIDGATSVSIALTAEAEQPLSHIGVDRWRLPHRDMIGPAVVTALGDAGLLDQRAVRFLNAPASEEYKRPLRRTDWFIEGARGTVLLENAEISSEEPCQVEALTKDGAWLGHDVGEFVTAEESATWIVTRRGKLNYLRQGPADASQRMPAAEAACDPRSRKWRKLVFNSEAEDVVVREARAAIRSVAFGGLPRKQFDQPPPKLDYTPAISEPLKVVDDVVSALAGRCAARAGISDYEWYGFLGCMPGIADREKKAMVSRAWEEAGLIDSLCHTRWRNRLIFARPPTVALFREHDRVIGVMRGLALPSTRTTFEQLAQAAGINVEKRCSFSPFVPYTLLVRLKSVDHIREIARRAGLALEFPGVDWEQFGRVRVHDAGPEPLSGYVAGEPLKRWAVDGSARDEVTMWEYSRCDRPDVWVVERDACRIWSFGQNLARIAGARLLGQPGLEATGDREAVATLSYFPLPIARAIAMLGLALPGPTPTWQYIYSFANPSFRDRAFELLSYVPAAAANPL